jgi:hypothetical protein
MSFPHLPSPLRLILWFTAFGAAIGVVYGRIVAMSEGSPPFTFDGVARGLLTGMVIAGILMSFETLVLPSPIGAPLQRAPFAVHVAVKSLVYLVVILFGLALGAWAFPGSFDHGIQRQDVLFSFAAAFVFTFIYDVNRLLGQNVLLNFVAGRYHRPTVEMRVFPVRGHGRVDGIRRAARPTRFSPPAQPFRHRSHRTDRGGARGNPQLCRR